MCQPVVLASGQGGPAGIAVDGTYVYWTASTDGTVNKVLKGGGSVTPIATGQASPVGVAVDMANVYWTNNGSPGAVMMAPLAGGSPSTITAESASTQIAVTATALFWLAGPGVFSAALGGGQRTQLQSLPPPYAYAFALDTVSMYWTTPGPGGAIYQAPLAGFTRTSIAIGATPAGIAVDISYVYWANSGNGTVVALAKDADGGAPTALATGQSTPTALAVDGNGVYWTNVGDGSIAHASPGSSGWSVSVLATGQDQPIAIALDATSVYWVTQVGSTVMRLAK